MTKKVKVRYLKSRLGCDPNWAKRALFLIWSRQTAVEKESQITSDENGVGFGKFDAEILSSFAEQLSDSGSLSPKQMNVLFRRIPRYWKQILSMIDQSKLEALIERDKQTANV